MKIYRAGDALPGALAGETVAVLGYGNLGRSAALNLRDSGVKVRIGNRDDEYTDQARADGFEVVPLATAAGADIVFVLLPDEVIPEVFARDVAPELRPGSAVAFGSGYSVERSGVKASPAPASSRSTTTRSPLSRARFPAPRHGRAIWRAKASGPASASKPTGAGALTDACSG